MRTGQIEKLWKDFDEILWVDITQELGQIFKKPAHGGQFPGEADFVAQLHVQFDAELSNTERRVIHHEQVSQLYRGRNRYPYLPTFRRIAVGQADVGVIE